MEKENVREKESMQKRQSDKKMSKQIRIDSGLHRLLKLKATDENTSIKKLLEGYLSELLEVKPNN